MISDKNYEARDMKTEGDRYMLTELEKVRCSDDPEVKKIEHHDHTVGKVTYRVWSAFLGRTSVDEALGALMLRRLERENGPADAVRTGSRTA